jgi:hypothetical protein
MKEEVQKGGPFYVYVIFRPNGVPCYVGKGKGKRWKTTWRKHNKALQNLMDRNGGSLPTVKIREGLTETEALETEIAFIRAIGRKKDGGPLYNLTDGGEGQTGWVPSEETRERISASNIGRKMSESARQKMSIAGRGRSKSAEHKAKIGAAHKGRKQTPEAVAKMKATRNSPEWKEALRLRALAQHAAMTEEQRAARKARISAATREAMARPDVVAKVSAAALENHSRRERTPEGRFA